jgi:hypothetical protein
MATNKDSMQQEAMPDVSVPPAGPGAASITIPRRHLLTGGAALVLAGGASGCNGNQNPVRTPFMAAFTAQFIGDPTKIKASGQQDDWPDPNRLWPKLQPAQTSAQILADYLTFMNALMMAGYVIAPLPNPGPSQLATDIANFLTAQNWPTSTTPPAGYPTLPLPTIHLIEICVIHDRLLQAINSYNPEKGGGGGGSSWPPH